MVENWRVKITMSRIETEPPVFCFDLDCSSTLTTFIRSRRSCWTTSSRLAASIVAVLRSPLASRAVYVNVGIAYSSNDFVAELNGVRPEPTRPS